MPADYTGKKSSDPTQYAAITPPEERKQYPIVGARRFRYQAGRDLQRLLDAGAPLKAQVAFVNSLSFHDRTMLRPAQVTTLVEGIEEHNRTLGTAGEKAKASLTEKPSTPSKTIKVTPPGADESKGAPSTPHTSTWARSPAYREEVLERYREQKAETKRQERQRRKIAETLATLDEYKVGDGYDLNAAVRDGHTATALSQAGFPMRDIAAAYGFNKGHVHLKATDEWVSVGAWNGMTKRQQSLLSLWGVERFNESQKFDLVQFQTAQKMGMSVADYKAWQRQQQDYNIIHAEGLKSGVLPPDLPGTVTYMKWQLGRIGDILIPGMWARHWKDMSDQERILNTALDLFILIPVLKAGGSAVRASLRPSVLRVMRSATKLEKAYKSANAAVRAMTVESMARKPLLPRYTRLANKAQTAIARYRKAHRTFLSAFERVKALTPQQLKAMEKKSGIKGLARAVSDVQRSQQALDEATTATDRLFKRVLKLLKRVKEAQAGSPTKAQMARYNADLRALKKTQAKLSGMQTRLTKAKQKADAALSGFTGKLQPRHRMGPPPPEFQGFDMRVVSRRKGRYEGGLNVINSGRRYQPPRGPAQESREGFRMVWSEEPVKGHTDPLIDGLEGYLKDHARRTRLATLAKEVAEKQKKTWTLQTEPMTTVTKPSPAKVHWQREGAGLPKPWEKPQVTKKARAKYKEKAPAPELEPKPEAPKVKDTKTKTKTTPVPHKREAPDPVPSEEYGRLTQAQIADLYQSETDAMVDAVSRTALQDLVKEKVVPRPHQAAQEHTAAKQAVHRAVSQGAKAFLDTATDVKTKTRLDTTVRPSASGRVSERVQSAVKTAVQTSIATSAMVHPAAPTATAVVTAHVVAPATAIAKAPSRIRPRLRPKRILGLPSGGKEWTEKDFEGSVAWKQGIMYWVFRPPFASSDDLRPFRNLPKGVTLAKDARSAYDTIQTIHGKPPRYIPPIQMGFQRIEITQPSHTPGRRGSIKFTSTRGNGGPAPTGLVSVRRGRIYETQGQGGKLLSRRPLGSVRRRKR